MKRLIAYFVSGMRTASFVYLSLVLLAQFYSGITYPAPTTKYSSFVFDEWNYGGIDLNP